MQELLMVLWTAFNLVFGLWTLRNLLVYTYAKLSGRRHKQTDLGVFLDMVVRASIIAQLLYLYY